VTENMSKAMVDILRPIDAAPISGMEMLNYVVGGCLVRST
jgi:hypothetical protein